MDTDSTAYLKDFSDRIENNDYPGFLKIWEEYCYGDQPDGEEMIAILDRIKESDLAKAFGLQVERLIPLWRQLTDLSLAHQVLMLLVDLQTTNSEQLADLATEHLKAKFANDPMLHEKLRLVGLRNREDFQGAIRNFELLTHMEVGHFVYHTAGWGTGEITDISFVREELTLEFEQVVGLHTLTFDKAFKTLTPLQKTHFYARRFGNPDQLEKEAKEDPDGLIRMLLSDLGPKTTAEIKEELLDLVIPVEDWNRWWQTARAKLKKDTKIECPKSLQLPFRLREKELPHEVVLHRALEAKPAVHAVIQMVYLHLRDFSETLKNEEFRSSLARKLQTLLETESVNHSQKLQLLFLLEDLKIPESTAEILSLLKESQNLSELVLSIDVTAFQKKALQKIEEISAHWSTIFLDLIYELDHVSVRDYILSSLSQETTAKQLQEKVLSLLLHPTSSPESFVWYFQRIFDKKTKLPFSDSQGKNQFFEGLLILLDYIEKRPQYKDLTKKVIHLVTEDRYLLVRNVMQHSTIDEVREYLLLATKCHSFTDHDIRIFYSLAEVVHPSLAKNKQVEEDDVIWTTESGYHHIQSRMQQIATVETVNNAKEIETARALGDLRENAEFKAALERRDRLQAELKLLSNQIAKARIITPADVPADEVGIGSIVLCQDSKGQQHSFTLLGPWDADPEKKVLSFQSKFAKAMIGRSVGQTFTFQENEFTILGIDNYFDQKE